MVNYSTRCGVNGISENGLDAIYVGIVWQCNRVGNVGTIALPPPVALGHEGAGIVERVGESDFILCDLLRLVFNLSGTANLFV